MLRPAEETASTEFASSTESSLAAHLAARDTTTWIERYDPGNSWGGYNLMLYSRRMPILVDMNGQLLHTWPNVRVTARARLTPKGNLVFVSLKNVIQIVDWDGDLIFEYRLENPRDLFHHDLAILDSGNILGLVRNRSSVTDYLLEIDPESGDVVWQWHLTPQLERHLTSPKIDGKRPKYSHCNSVHELRDNPWFDNGDTRFRPGNLLLSARNYSIIFVIDKNSGDVVWTYDHKLDFQHEAVMIPDGYHGAGHFLVFNNGYKNVYAYRSSTIMEIQPVTKKVTWSYSSPYFFSRTGGVQQALPNGNVLITSSGGWRVFEVDRKGEIVWQWLPPYRPMRISRYPYDYSDQFQTFPTPVESVVSAPLNGPYVDRSLYQFGLSHAVRDITLGKQKFSVLKQDEVCRRLMVPDEATLALEFGIDRRAATCRGSQECSGIFQATLQSEQDERIELMNTTIRLSQPEQMKKKKFDLSEYAYEQIELCLKTYASSNLQKRGKRSPLLWGNPTLRAKREPIEDSGLTGALSREEEKTLAKQLKALGYMD